jgi:serine/threonine-protein kinase
MAFTEGALAGETLDHVVAHLDRCEPCREVVAALAGGTPFDGPDLAPKRVGPWRLVRKLSEGGMGSVYVADHERTKQRVALKVLIPTLLDDPSMVSRLRREAQVLQKIRHRHVVRVLEFGGFDEGQVWVALELLDGETLAARLRRGPLPFDLALRWLTELTSGLVAAHEARVVHRDLTPANVFLVDDGRRGPSVKLLDFGFARARDQTAMTRSGALIGTTGYLAPEYLRGKPVTEKADLYALGCLAWAMVMGRPVFKGGTVQVLMAHLEQTPESLADVAVVPRAFAELVDELLEKRPEDRPESAAEVLRRLRDAAMGKTVAGTRADQPTDRMRPLKGQRPPR